MDRQLDDPELMAATDRAPDTPVLPDVTVLKIGGQSSSPLRHPRA